MGGSFSVRPFSYRGVAMSRTPRNAPCPCGSGRKYKTCCLAHEEAAIQASRVEERAWHRIQDWALERHADEHGAGIERFVGPSRELVGAETLVLCSWLHIDYEPGDRGSFAERYAARPDLDSEERDVAVRIAAARLGLHRVLAVESGEWIDLESVTRGTRVRVRSREISREAVRWDVLLCRVMRGVHEASLWGPAAFYAPDEEPELMEELIRLAGQLRVPTDPDGLDKVFRRAALRLVQFIPPSRSIEPVLVCVEGHPAAHAEAVWIVSDPIDALEALETPPEVLWMGPEDERDCFVWTLPNAEVARRRGSLPRGALVLSCTPVTPGEAPPDELEDRVAVGSFELAGSELSFSALSSERLDDACALVAARLGEDARLLRREVTALDEALAARRSTPGPPHHERSPLGLSGKQVSEIEASFVERQYRRFLDEPHPRLGGLTPRQAASDGVQLPELRLLVRGIENHTERARREGGAVPDLSWLRDELGLSGALAA